MRRIILTTLFAAAASAALFAQTGEAPCTSYQACLAKAQTRRWTDLADTIQKSADTLRRLREVLRAAEKNGDMAQAARLRALEPRDQVGHRRPGRASRCLHRQGDGCSFFKPTVRGHP
jgi:hypothetical protein